jgi:hypothetical protein
VNKKNMPLQLGSKQDIQGFKEFVNNETQVKEGVIELFESNPELANIGTQEQYFQYLDSLNKPNTNPILQGNQKEQVKKFVELQERLNNKEFIEGAKNAYESSEGLKSFGTQEQYNDYIARVSLGIVKNPSSGGYNYTSKVKDIVYHGLNAYMPKGFKFDLQTFVFDKSLQRKGSMQGMEDGIFFSNDKEFVQNNFTKYGLFGALLNIKTPKVKGEVEYWKDHIEYLTTKEESLGGKTQLDYLAKGIRPISWNKYKGYEQEVEALKKKGYSIEEVDGYFIRLSKLNPMEETYFAHLKKAIDNNAYPYHTNMAGKIIQEAIKNNQDGVIFENLLEESSNNVHNQYVVFEPEQIHILASKQDIEGFKGFVSSQQSTNDITEMLKASDSIVYTNEEGQPCAAKGMTNKIQKGGKWKVEKDLSGYPSHSRGGIDIKIGKDGFSFARGEGVIKAAHGLVLPKI